MKKTTSQILRERKVKQPSRFVNGLFRVLLRPVYNAPCKAEYIRHIDPDKYKDRPVIIVCNHASRFDFAFVQGAMKKRRINFVAAEQEFHRTKFKLVFGISRTIPKKSFVPDATTIRGMTTILKKTKNGCVTIFPCGLSTVGGAQQPSMSGTGKMLKHFGVTVLAVRIHGAYLVCPKFDVKERYGKVEVEFDELFTPEQLEQLDVDTIERKVDEAIYTDDYEWNATRQYSYNRKDGKYADKLEQILYKCPKCGTEMEMVGHDNVIECKHCGNSATLDDKYNLDPVGDSVIPINPREWYDWERRAMRRAIADKDFYLEEHVTLGMQPTYGYVKHGLQTYPVGEGTLRVDHSGVTYKGTRDGKDWEVFIPREQISTTIINIDASFLCTYASGEFLMFTPDRYASVRLNFAIEEIYRIHGGKWQNFPWFDYDKQGFTTK
ncbi:MAG: 1-acyl-sn-glycerol-3-phosphate acyltransferase [Clostridia bacterium]|nr:1-acyl-sn-glycerol-3-phosphate acyltransferase [Clostridia bacterium]